MYRPDVNESMMMIEALEKAVQKTIQSITKEPGIKPSAVDAKLFVQNAYLVVETYKPELVQHSIEKIVESDLKNLSGEDIHQAYDGLVTQIYSILDGISQISENITVMYRSVPVHYRVGYMFRDTTAKSTKKGVAAIEKTLQNMLKHLDNSYPINENSHESN